MGKLKAFISCTDTFCACGGISFSDKEKGEKRQNAVYTVFVSGRFVAYDMLKVCGSFTVEAAIIVPMVLTVFVLAIRGGVALYGETKELAVEIKQEESPEVLKHFYRWQMVEDLMDGEDKD